jgi:hypothetical protein
MLWYIDTNKINGSVWQLVVGWTTVKWGKGERDSGVVKCMESVLCNAHFGRHRSLALQLRLIPVKSLLSAILQIIASMVFWKTMLAEGMLSVSSS